MQNAVTKRQSSVMCLPNDAMSMNLAKQASANVFEAQIDRMDTANDRDEAAADRPAAFRDRSM